MACGECVICRKKLRTKNNGSGYESLQQCVTESGAQTLLNYADKSDDEHVKVKLAAAASLAATVDENNEKQRETTLQEHCFNEVKSIVEKDLI